ncbi:MAG TPA: hypothetical protein VIV60_25975 [Polyangiaceae bacterium]
MMLKYLARISIAGMLALGLYISPAAGDSEKTTVNPTERVSTIERAVDQNASKDSGALTKAGGGYSWSDKRQGSKHGRAFKRLDPLRPLLQAPNFELRPDGSSVVTLPISKSTEVTRITKGQLIEYQLKDAQVGVQNNLNPLITAHFNTPLDRIVLRRTDSGAALILVLREPAQPLHLVRNAATGGALLEVTLPRPTRAYAPAAVQPSARAPREPKPATFAAAASRRKGRHMKAPAGPGPIP